MATKSSNVRSLAHWSTSLRKARRYNLARATGTPNSRESKRVNMTVHCGPSSDLTRGTEYSHTFSMHNSWQTFLNSLYCFLWVFMQGSLSQPRFPIIEYEMHTGPVEIKDGNVTGIPKLMLVLECICTKTESFATEESTSNIDIYAWTAWGSDIPLKGCQFEAQMDKQGKSAKLNNWMAWFRQGTTCACRGWWFAEFAMDSAIVTLLGAQVQVKNVRVIAMSVRLSQHRLAVFVDLATRLQDNML